MSQSFTVMQGILNQNRFIMLKLVFLCFCFLYFSFSPQILHHILYSYLILNSNLNKYYNTSVSFYRITTKEKSQGVQGMSVSKLEKTTKEMLKEWIWCAKLYPLVAISLLLLLFCFFNWHTHTQEQSPLTTHLIRPTASVLTNVAQREPSCIATDACEQSRSCRPHLLTGGGAAEGRSCYLPPSQPSGERIYRREQLNSPSNYSILRRRHQIRWLPPCSVSSSCPALNSAAALLWHRSALLS